MNFSMELNNNEKKFHVIWIGKLPLHELDNLKIWAKFNPDFDINIWIDSNHMLAPLLRQLIIANTKDTINGQDMENPLLAASLQNKFYNEFNRQRQEKSFHEFTKAFIIEQGWKTKTEINQWINDGNDSLNNQETQLQKFTKKKVTIRDVHLEHNIIFDDQQYYDIYLRELEEANFAVGASDLLRYQILKKEGGIYLDTDILPLIDFGKVFKIVNHDDVISLFPHDNTMLIINEIMKLIIFKQLDHNNLHTLKDKVDKRGIKTPEIESWKKLSSLLVDNIINWEQYIAQPELLNPELDCAILNQWGKLSNAFIISKQNSFLLEEVQNKIKYNYQLTFNDENEIINNLLQKIISNMYVLLKTGPGVFPERWLGSSCKLMDVCSIETLNAETTWVKQNVENFALFEDLKTKYTGQHLLTKNKPDIKQLQNYQVYNQNKLFNLKDRLNEILTSLDDSDNINCPFIIDNLEENKIKLQEEIVKLEQIQKLISQKNSSPAFDFDCIIAEINKKDEYNKDEYNNDNQKKLISN